MELGSKTQPLVAMLVDSSVLTTLPLSSALLLKIFQCF